MYRMKLTPFFNFWFSTLALLLEASEVVLGKVSQSALEAFLNILPADAQHHRIFVALMENGESTKPKHMGSKACHLLIRSSNAAWMYLGVGSLLKEPENRKYAVKICKTQHSPHIWINYFTNLHQGATGKNCSIHQEGNHQNLQQVFNLWSLIASYPWLRNLVGSCFACSQLRLLGSDGDPHQVGCTGVQTAILSEICLVLVSMFL